MPHILKILNLSYFFQDVLQAELEHSNVVPTRKYPGSESENLINYRPIRITPIFAKIIEKAALYQKNTFLVENNSLICSKLGYKKFSTYKTALMKIVNDAQREVFKKKCVMLFMLDRCAAFDTSHQWFLIEVMDKPYGFDNKVIRWIEIDLKKRIIAVIINGSESRMHKHLYGVS